MLAYILKIRWTALMDRFLMSLSSLRFSRLISFMFYFITILMLSSSLRCLLLKLLQYLELLLLTLYQRLEVSVKLSILSSRKRKTYLNYTPTYPFPFLPSFSPLTYNHSSISSCCSEYSKIFCCLELLFSGWWMLGESPKICYWLIWCGGSRYSIKRGLSYCCSWNNLYSWVIIIIIVRQYQLF